MTLMFPKTPRLVDEKYRIAVRSMPCVVTGYQWFDGAPLGVDPAHIRDGMGGGMGRKPDDNLILPLRHDLHLSEARLGEVAMWRINMTDDLMMRGLKALARETYEQWRAR
jgi:hypothetical protein